MRIAVRNSSAACCRVAELPVEPAEIDVRRGPFEVELAGWRGTRRGPCRARRGSADRFARAARSPAGAPPPSARRGCGSVRRSPRFARNCAIGSKWQQCADGRGTHERIVGLRAPPAAARRCRRRILAGEAQRGRLDDRRRRGAAGSRRSSSFSPSGIAAIGGGDGGRPMRIVGPLVAVPFAHRLGRPLRAFRSAACGNRCRRSACRARPTDRAAGRGSCDRAASSITM